MDARIKHPYREGFPALLGLIGLSGGIALVAAILSWLNVASLEAVTWFFGLFALLWVLIMVVAWLMGLRKMHLVRRFLASDRPLVRWTYSLPEWEALKEARKAETQEDWKLAFGGLTVIMALAGGLTGALIGFDEGVGEGILGGLVGIVIGGIFGGALGLIVGGGNALAALRAYREEQPEHVALGAREIYANEGYFKSDGEYRTIRRVRLESGPPPLLIVDVCNPKIRGSAEETWEIVVPSRMVGEVERVLPRIDVVSDPSTEEGVA